jgi:hypothetical protein
MNTVCGLTNNISIGDWPGQWVRPGTSLSIIGRTTHGGRRYMDLRDAEHNLSAKYGLKGAFRSEGCIYAVLEYAAAFATDEAAPEQSVLRVENRDVVETISDQELARATADCLSEIEREPYDPDRACSAVLGDFMPIKEEPMEPKLFPHTADADEDVLVSRQVRGTWFDVSVGDYVIDAVLGEGTFSRVYRGTRSDGSRKAFKVAIQPGARGAAGTTTRVATTTACFNTEAFQQITGAICPIRPETDQLLLAQAEKLAGISDRGVVRIEAIETWPMAYYAMECVEGPTLRRLMRRGRVPIGVFVDLARVMDRVSRTPAFACHGDLKPENVIVTKGSVKIIDPGHFGKLRNRDGHLSPVTVTTPQYYPFLRPNDLYAFGLMLAEAILKRHPLQYQEPPGSPCPNLAGDDLQAQIDQMEMVGNHYFSPILGFCRRRSPSLGLPPNLERLVWRSLGLRAARRITLDRGYRNFREIGAALSALAEEGIEYL